MDAMTHCPNCGAVFTDEGRIFGQKLRTYVVSLNIIKIVPELEMREYREEGLMRDLQYIQDIGYYVNNRPNIEEVSDSVD